LRIKGVVRVSTKPSGKPKEPDEPAGKAALDERQPIAEAAAADTTVGTGSVFAIGCVVLALVVIFLGIAIFFLR